jgi:hypothetical protein
MCTCARPAGGAGAPELGVGTQFRLLCQTQDEAPERQAWQRLPSSGGSTRTAVGPPVRRLSYKQSYEWDRVAADLQLGVLPETGRSPSRSK